MAIVVSIGAFIATLLGGLFALYLQDRLHLILGFSAGALIGVAFFDLLPESLDLASAALARISHTGRCIGVLFLRKSCCDNSLSQDQGSPDADRV